MGTIASRARRNGTIRYTAQIRIHRDGKLAYTESKTFDRRPVAAAWLKRRQGELEQPGGLGRATTVDPPLAAAIERYVRESEKKIGRTKAQVLRAIKNDDIGDLNCGAIGSAEIVAFLRRLDVEPQTRGNYLSHLAAVFAIARPAWKYPLDQQAMKDAAAVAKRLGLVSKSRQRDRRPTLEQLDRILAHFTDRSRRRPDAAPMATIVAFAIFSTRRLDEITRLSWTDLEADQQRILVRDMKNPGEKEGNDVWCDLVPEATRIILSATPRGADARIFPYNSDSIGTAFTRAMQILDIEDLHFHDLRHDGISRLFEMGWTIPRVAGVSGHRTWQSLQRYTHLRQVGDKYAGWPWLARLAAP